MKRGSQVWLALMAFWGSILLTSAADLKLDVRLIWGTNTEKSPNPKHKPVETEMAKKLQKVFKWKWYFEVNRQDVMVPSRAAKKFRVSDKCEIEITEQEGPKVEVKLFGEGKLVNKTVKSLNKGEYFTLAGDDKDDNAWFVVIKLVDEIQSKDKK